MLNELIHHGITIIVGIGTVYLLPAMVVLFTFGVVVRMVMYFTTRCEYLFAVEFEKRMYSYLADPERKKHGSSFHHVTKNLLEKTYHEHFELKQKYKRRRFDHITSITDRLFLIQAGAMRLVTDTLSQTKYLQRGNREPRFLDIAKFVFSSNPMFNRIMGIFPVGVFHDTISILPGIFLVSGIFGTFLGTMATLPMLSDIDPTNVELTKTVMDGFLKGLTYSMGKSVLGIVLSVSMTFLNTVFSPEGMYINMVNKFTSSLEFLWNDTETNEVVEESVAEIDPRTGLPHLEPVGPLAKLQWKGKPKPAANDGKILKRPQEGEEITALRDRIGVLDQLIDQTESQKGTVAPQVWGEQLHYLKEEKKKLETELSFKLADKNKVA